MPLAGPLGGERGDQLSGRDAADRGSRSDRELGTVPFWEGTAGERCWGFYFKKFPKHQPVIEEKMEFFAQKRLRGSVCEQAAPYGKDADFHSPQGW